MVLLGGGGWGDMTHYPLPARRSTAPELIIPLRCIGNNNCPPPPHYDDSLKWPGATTYVGR